MRSLFAVIGLLTLVTACSKPGPDDVSPSSGAGAYLEVLNNYALPVEVSIRGNGTTQRLGTVHPGMSGHYRLPQGMVNSTSVVFIAQAGPSSVYRSGEMTLIPGRIVDLSVSATLFNSSAVIRP